MSAQKSFAQRFSMPTNPTMIGLSKKPNELKDIRSQETLIHFMEIYIKIDDNLKLKCFK